MCCHSITRALLALGAICALHQTAVAQAWTQPAGRTYLKLSYGSATAGEQYGFDGQRKLYADDVYAPAFFDRSVYLYGEVGLTPNITFVGALPYKRLTVRDTTFKYAAGGVGDVDAGLRFNLNSLLGWLPGTVAINTRLTLPTGYVRNSTPAPGMGQVNAAVTLDWGHGFGKVYAQVGAGYRLRTGWYGLSSAVPCQAGQDRGCVADEQATLGDEYLGSAEVGYSPWRWLLVQALGSAVVSVTAPSVGFTAQETQPTQQRYLKLGAGLRVAPVEAIGISAQVFATPWGRNTIRSVDVFLGLDTTFHAWGG
ncbi:MAG: hypothetical protein ACI9U2_001226 [Bradymonadia bacterium]|jgi:hypothetical protein